MFLASSGKDGGLYEDRRERGIGFYHTKSMEPSKFVVEKWIYIPENLKRIILKEGNRMRAYHRH
jgi:hypothetical protein